MSAVDAVGATGSATVRYPLPQQAHGPSGYAATAAGTPGAAGRGGNAAPRHERLPAAGTPTGTGSADLAAAKRPAVEPAPRSVEMRVQHRSDGAEAVVLVDRLSGREVFALPPEQVSRAVDAALQRRRLGLSAAAGAQGPEAAAGTTTDRREGASRTQGTRRGDH